MTLLKRIESLFMQEALSSGAGAVQFRDKTTGSAERSGGPSGGWRLRDRAEIENLFLAACTAAEKLSGYVWKDGQHQARKHKPYDEREWQINVLANPEYVGKSSSYVSANEDVEEWTIRNLRKAHNFDSKGVRKDPCGRRSCSLCPAVDELVSQRET